MALTIESLKGLYEKLGGEDFGNVSTIPEAIDKVTEVATGGGGGGGGGDNNDYPVTAILTAGESGFAITQVSKSAFEIKSAFDAGKTVHLVIDGSILGATFDLPMTEIASDDHVWFAGEISFGGVTPAVMIVEINEDADPEMAFVELPPAFDATDIGKQLGVVSDGHGGAAMSWLDSKAPLIVSGTADPMVAHTAEITDEISLADIYNAAQDGRYVAFECSLGTGNTTRIPLAGYTKNGDSYDIAFSVASNVSGNPATISVDFETGSAGTAGIYVPQ